MARARGIERSLSRLGQFSAVDLGLTLLSAGDAGPRARARARISCGARRRHLRRIAATSVHQGREKLCFGEYRAARSGTRAGDPPSRGGFVLCGSPCGTGAPAEYSTSICGTAIPVLISAD